MADKVADNVLGDNKNAARNRAILTGVGILGAVIAAHHYWPKGILYGDADDSWSPKKEEKKKAKANSDYDQPRRRQPPSPPQSQSGAYSDRGYPPRARSGKYFYDDNNDDDVRPPRRRSRSAVRPTSYYEAQAASNPNPNFIPPKYVEEAVYTRPHRANDDTDRGFYDELASARGRARPKSYVAPPPPPVPVPPPVTREGRRGKKFYDDEGYGSGSGSGSGGSVAGSRGYADDGGNGYRTSRRGSVDYDAGYDNGNGYRRLARRDSNRYRIENGFDR